MSVNADAKVTERQCAVWQSLLRRRFDTASNLAVEFHVSVRTMQNDLHELMLSHPIESFAGVMAAAIKWQIGILRSSIRCAPNRSEF